ncbi:MAG: hypothetical protein M1825_001276 [Sarcosagium campestre]|nr:MAG: hypothetical protein M1825_001276 [Sarcosagium campestre]
MATTTTTVITTAAPDEETRIQTSYGPVYNPIRARPVEVTRHKDGYLFLARPLFGPLLFDNNDSDARDHCGCERTFLSWLRLSIYMAIVSVAIVISFHLKRAPTPTERKLALPFGILFWFLSLVCLASGLSNYVNTVTRYSRRQALVQTGWKTHTVVTVVACAIIAACIFFLTTNAKQDR